MKKVVRIVILSVFAFCLSIACKNYTEDIEDYLSYWSAGVSITEYRFEPQPQIYTEGMQCVSSKAPVTVTFTVHNSKNLHLKMPGDSDAPADIISFPHIPDAPDKRAAAPQSGNDYGFKKISNTALTLTYNPAFLQKYEWGRGDITPSIILYTTDGRVFKQNIPFKLNVNTPPPAIAECVVGQTTTHLPSETSYYVLCLQLSDDDMKKTCGNGLLHGDIAGIEINGTIYRLSVAGPQKQLNVQGNSSFIGKDKVKRLAITGAKEIPSDWTLYFKTDAPVGSPKTDAYTVRLKDAKGLYSEPVTVGTQGKIVTLTFNLAGGNIDGNTDAIKKTGVPGASFTPPANPTKAGYTFNSWDPTLPSPPVFPDADTTYTAQWTPKTYTVTFKVDGGQGGTLTGTHDGTTHTTNGSTQLQFESVPHNSTITFTATPDSGYEVDSWAGAQQDTSDNKKASLTVQNNVTVIVKFKAVGGQGPTIEATSWEELRAKVQSATEGTIIEIAQNLTYNISHAVGKDSIIEVNNNITIKSKGSGTYTLNAGGKGADSGQSNAKSTGIFEVSGNKTLTLENLILTKTEKYAVYVAENSSLTMKNVTIKDCKTDYNAAGIYFRKGKDLTLENCTIEKCKGTITANLASGGIDIEEPTGTVSIKDTEIKNCEVTGTQSTGGGIHLYKGTCTLTNVIIQECKAPKGGGMCVNAGTLTITGGSFTKNEATGTGTDIQGGAIYSEDGRLTLKSCMIGGNNSGDGNRAKKGGGIYLKNVALTMQSVTVKNNKALTQGAGIYLAAGELKIPGGNTIADNSIIDNGNSEAGGGIYVEKGMLTLDGGSIDGNSANANKGGGVHLKAGTFTMNSGEIKNCSAKYGGGVSLANRSSFTMTGGSITECKADGEGGVGGGIYTGAKTQLTLEGTNSNPVVISNCTAKKTGGGMHIYTNNPVTVKNARIEGNTAENGGGVYLEQGTFTIAGSTRITPSTEATAGKNDVFLKGEKFITIEGTLTETGTVARITPENYADGVRVLQALPTECAKFTVTPNSAGTWQVESNGTLKKQ